MTDSAQVRTEQKRVYIGLLGEQSFPGWRFPGGDFQGGDSQGGITGISNLDLGLSTLWGGAWLFLELLGSLLQLEILWAEPGGWRSSGVGAWPLVS